VSASVRFGPFEFDPASMVLTRAGRPVRLQPQPARVLAVLLEQPGAIVSRDALRDRIWSDGTFVDFERGLNFCVAQIRAALGDSAESPRYVETLPRRGYRFIAPVSALGPAVSANAPVSPQSPPHRRPAGIMMVALAVLAVLTAFLVAGAWRGGSASRPIRIAVVPFDNETGLDEFDAIARGVADATVARLSTPERVRRFSIIGNAAALYQPRAFRDLKRIGRTLDATYIVLAQMKRDAAEVRLIAHLIRIDDERHVWANTYDRPAFTLDVQSEIAESIAAAVVDAVSRPSSPRAATR
jgi:DNA-binding winged helix-turn-helix (wHTH) protein/TolB-like protein